MRIRTIGIVSPGESWQAVVVALPVKEGAE